MSLKQTYEIIFTITVAILLVTSRPSTTYSAEASSKMVDKIAAIVGTDVILFSEIIEKARPLLIELKKTTSGQNTAMMMIEHRANQVVKDSLKGIIDDTLVRQQAGEMKVTVTTEEVEMTIANMARENGVDIDTFKKALEAAGKNMTTYKAEMRRDLLKYKVLNLRVRGRINITEEEAREYYNNQVRDVRETGSFEGAHILIQVTKNARALEVATKKKQAQEIINKIIAGQSFEKLAKKTSEDKSTSSEGGRLGEKNAGEFEPAMNRAFLDMEAGETVGPVRTSAGFHILHLIKREELGIQPFSEVKARIINQLMQAAMVRQQTIWLKELRLRTFIDIRI